MSQNRPLPNHDKDKKLLLLAMNAVAHYQEYVDTGEPMDLAAARASLDYPEMTEWLEEYIILLPLRRDNKTLLGALRDSA